MDRGNIPGFYYDEEKKKYFRIQANHKVPSDSKYAQSNVRQERRQAQKRKRELRFEERRKMQTIRRSRISDGSGSALVGFGLSRELGVRDAAAADVAMASHLVASTTRVEPLRPDVWVHGAPSIIEAFSVPDRNGTLLVSSGASTSGFNLVADPDPPWPAKWNASETLFTMPVDASVRASSVWPAQEPRLLIACATVPGCTEDRLCALRFPPDHSSGRARMPKLVILHIKGGPEFWDTAISADGKLALAGSDGLIHLPPPHHGLFPVNHLSLDAECHALDWLTPDTLAGGAGRSVVLWDTRTSGSRARFEHPGRITGVAAAGGGSGAQLLVSGNRGLTLYDARMLSGGRDRYPVRFPLLHEGPRLSIGADGPGHLVAAASHGAVKVFSLPLGREVRALELPAGTAAPFPSQVAWREDARGAPYLLACLGDRIARWSWGGRG